MHFYNASWTNLANYACINRSILDKEQGVYSDIFLILLHLLLYFEVGRCNHVGALEIFVLRHAPSPSCLSCHFRCGFPPKVRSRLAAHMPVFAFLFVHSSRRSDYSQPTPAYIRYPHGYRL